MAEYALPPGAIRKRAVFGLLDADGWAWATIRATFWFLLIIFLQGYVPDRAYYFTVSPTLDLGFNAISPINLCPAENKGLPCPAPAGAVIPWEQNPAELALPAGRAGAGVFTSGEHIYVIGGRTPEGAANSVLHTTMFEGNLTAWQEGPALPQPRSDAAIINVSGVPYVVGGSDAAGAPTTTVFVGVVTEGELTGWEEATDLALPVGLTDLVGTSTAGGMYVFGGSSVDGLSNRTFLAEIPEGETTVEPWIELTELPLPEARADASAISAGGAVYVIGGRGPSGPTNSVFFLGFDTNGHPKVNFDTNRPFGWGISVGPSASAALPEARYGHSSFTNSGTIYAVGGYDANGSAVQTVLWAVPDATNGTIAAWRRLDVTDLPAPRAESITALVGQYAFVVGGTEGGQALESSIDRADVAPRLPFFRLGLFGLTIPALSIKGEIGQQLGYIIAASAALGNFVILTVIAWMFSHRRASFRFFEWITRGR